MPELPSLTPLKVIRVLEKKGFILDRIKGSHHLYYILKEAGISKDELRKLL